MPESGSGLVEIVSRYTQTFLWLQQYDEGLLEEPTGQSGGALPSHGQAMTTVFCDKESSLQRWQQTQWCFFVRRFSESKRPLAQCA